MYVHMYVYNSWVNLCVFGTGRYSLSLFTQVVMEKHIYAFIYSSIFTVIMLLMNDMNSKDSVALK